MARQVEAQPTLAKKSKKPRFGPRLHKFLRTGLSNEGVGWAQGPGCFDIGEGFSDFGDSTETSYQAEYRRAAAERTKLFDQVLAMTGMEYRIVDAEARAKLRGEVEPPYLDHPP